MKTTNQALISYRARKETKTLPNALPATPPTNNSLDTHDTTFFLFTIVLRCIKDKPKAKNKTTKNVAMKRYPTRLALVMKEEEEEEEEEEEKDVFTY